MPKLLTKNSFEKKNKEFIPLQLKALGATIVDVPLCLNPIMLESAAHLITKLSKEYL